MTVITNGSLLSFDLPARIVFNLLRLTLYELTRPLSLSLLLL